MYRATDYRIELSWWRHRKCRRLRRELGAEGVLALVQLWGFAAELRPTGVLDGMTATDIAEESEYDGDAEALVACLVRNRLLDAPDGACAWYRLHDWESHQEHVVRCEQAGKERAEHARKAANLRWEKREMLNGAQDHSGNAQLSIGHAQPPVGHAQSQSGNAFLSYPILPAILPDLDPKKENNLVTCSEPAGGDAEGARPARPSLNPSKAAKAEEPPEDFTARQRAAWQALREAQFRIPGDGQQTAWENVDDPVRLARDLGGPAYPAVDVNLIYRLASWSQSSPKRRKNLNLFLRNRFGASQERGGDSRLPTGAPAKAAEVPYPHGGDLAEKIRNMR